MTGIPPVPGAQPQPQGGGGMAQQMLGMMAANQGQPQQPHPHPQDQMQQIHSMIVDADVAISRLGQTLPSFQESAQRIHQELNELLLSATEQLPRPESAPPM